MSQKFKRKYDVTLSAEEIADAFENQCSVDAVVMPPPKTSEAAAGVNDSGIEEESTGDPTTETESDIKLCNDEIEGTDTVFFNPPVYIQRYLAVSKFLNDQLIQSENKTPKAILEYGCAEYGMLKYLKHLPNVEKLLFVDKDEKLLQNVRTDIY